MKLRISSSLISTATTAVLILISLTACNNDEVNPCDTVPQKIAITNPANGTAIAGTSPELITITTSDTESRVNRVLVWVDDVLLPDSPAFTPPWSFSRDALNADPGDHITKQAIDYLGNTATATVSVTLEFCTEYEIRGILQTDENGTIFSGDTGDWCYENDGLAGPGIVYPAYPNPADPSSTLRVGLESPVFVTVCIINDRCQDVRTLI